MCVCLWQLEMFDVMHWIIKLNYSNCDVCAATESDKLCCDCTQWALHYAIVPLWSFILMDYSLERVSEKKIW